ncbi:MAG TPA: alpha-amylase family glycosyl hydrolase, partial [Puia sp.]
MKKALFLLSTFLFLISYFSFASGYEIPDFYPTHWWVGMKNPKLQLMVHAANISGDQITISYSGVKLIKVTRLENKNYIFLDLIITPEAKPGKIKINFKSEEGDRYVYYELKPRRKDNGNAYAQGVTAADLIYLIMPDRFSNGDPSNDKFADMNDTSSDRNNPFLRHGGDLEGITNHLDYFNDLGVTALWLTPVIENDQSLTNEGGSMRSAYHGYAFTNHYKIDKRFGGNEAYKKLVSEAHAHGIKIIQDAVYNHIGNKHFLFL